MKEVAKGTVDLIEIIIMGGCPNFVKWDMEGFLKGMVNKLLDKINERKSVSDSPIKLFNLLINSLLLIKNEKNLDIENYVDTVSKLTYNRYQIKKHIEEEQNVLANKIREKIETEQKTLFKSKKKDIA